MKRRKSGWGWFGLSSLIGLLFWLLMFQSRSDASEFLDFQPITPIASMQTVSAAVLLRDGRVFMIGPRDKSMLGKESPTTSCIYDPKTGQYTDTGLLEHPTNRGGVLSFSLTTAKC